VAESAPGRSCSDHARAVCHQRSAMIPLNLMARPFQHRQPWQNSSV
jgi:hypothetical protein